MRRLQVRTLIALLSAGVFVAGPATAQSKSTPEQRADRYLTGVRKQPQLALAFLREMPKGGDLHNHLSGSIYAETLIDYAAKDNLCLDRAKSSLVAAPCDDSCDPTQPKPAVACAYRDQDLYNVMIDAWSMRNWERGRESGHDHFFATFSKFGMATRARTADMIAQAMRQAAADHLQYVELMYTAAGGQAVGLGTKAGWNADFAAMRASLLAGGLKEVVAAAREEIETNDRLAKQKLGCQGDATSYAPDKPSAEPACDVTVRYLYQVLRGLAPEQVFAQILTGFELAAIDPRVVGLNLVMPEDASVPMRDFDLHMKMLDYLHGVYPKVHISLHAGELAAGLVPPDGLRFHIRESVEVGHAERIGHGVDVMNERDPLQLLKEMRERNVLVEICLTSNDVILGVKGNDHPLPIYRQYHVPVALATDDEGVSRSDLTHDYLRAVETYGLSYLDLKEMARQSLEHSFLPGKSFWADAAVGHPVSACAADVPHSTPSKTCREFLEANERAREQWELERQFTAFEKSF